MKAKKGVVAYLNKLLTNELTAINQYFLHAEMCENWGMIGCITKFEPNPLTK